MVSCKVMLELKVSNRKKTLRKQEQLQSKFTLMVTKQVYSDLWQSFSMMSKDARCWSTFAQTDIFY